jgi:hypothetical protein
MPQIVKLYLLGGTAVVDLVYSATSPIIQVYFISLIDSSILAAANILTAALAAGVNASIQSNKLKDFYRHHFLWIIVIDIICFALISFEGISIPEVRFLGLAILNAVSSTLWFMVVRDAINHQIEGDRLTKWNSLSETVNLTAALIGSVIAIIFTSIGVEYCIAAQCLANLFMGTTDWLAYKEIRY